MHILCGDIGGTKTRLAILKIHDQPLDPEIEQSYSSAKYTSLTEIVREFYQDAGIPVQYAAFGVAGPVAENRCNTTNLPWTIEAARIGRELGIPSVHLINDLEATAWGIESLNEQDIHTLLDGSANPTGNRAVIAAGTGLGQAGILWDGTRHIPFATEGGHCDFAPGNELEHDLLISLRQQSKQVCWEDLLSGAGLSTIYKFILQHHQIPIPAWLQQQTSSGDPAADICRLASENREPLCVVAMEIFTRIYGAEAGNLGLKLMARGGVYLAGGIAPKILDWLQTPAFLQAFTNKGKMQELMQTMPVRVILNDRAALYGPAQYLRAMLLRDQSES